MGLMAGRHRLRQAAARAVTRYTTLVCGRANRPPAPAAGCWKRRDEIALPRRAGPDRSTGRTCWSAGSAVTTDLPSRHAASALARTARPSAAMCRASGRAQGHAQPRRSPAPPLRIARTGLCARSAVSTTGTASSARGSRAAARRLVACRCRRSGFGGDSPSTMALGSSGASPASAANVSSRIQDARGRHPCNCRRVGSIGSRWQSRVEGATALCTRRRVRPARRARRHAHLRFDEDPHARGRPTRGTARLATAPSAEFPAPERLRIQGQGQGGGCADVKQQDVSSRGLPTDLRGPSTAEARRLPPARDAFGCCCNSPAPGRRDCAAGSMSDATTFRWVAQPARA